MKSGKYSDLQALSMKENNLAILCWTLTQFGCSGCSWMLPEWCMLRFFGKTVLLTGMRSLLTAKLNKKPVIVYLYRKQQ